MAPGLTPSQAQEPNRFPERKEATRKEVGAKIEAKKEEAPNANSLGRSARRDLEDLGQLGGDTRGPRQGRAPSRRRGQWLRRFLETCSTTRPVVSRGRRRFNLGRGGARGLPPSAVVAANTVPADRQACSNSAAARGAPGTRSKTLRSRDMLPRATDYHPQHLGTAFLLLCSLLLLSSFIPLQMESY